MHIRFAINPLVTTHWCIVPADFVFAHTPRRRPVKLVVNDRLQGLLPVMGPGRLDVNRENDFIAQAPQTRRRAKQHGPDIQEGRGRLGGRDKLGVFGHRLPDALEEQILRGRGQTDRGSRTRHPVGVELGPEDHDAFPSPVGLAECFHAFVALLPVVQAGAETRD